MKVVILHTKDAAEPPVDPVLGQLAAALEAAGHEPSQLAVDASVEPVVAALRAAEPELVLNVAESVGGFVVPEVLRAFTGFDRVEPR